MRPHAAGDFRLLGRRAVVALRRNHHMKRLLAWIGVETGATRDGRSPRVDGRAKWSTAGPSRPAIHGVASLPLPPFRWTAVLAAVSAAGAGLLGLWLATSALLPGVSADGSPSLLSGIGFVGGMQLLDERLFVLLNSLGSERWDGLWLFVTHKLAWIPLYAALVYLLYRNFGLKNTLIIIAMITVMAAVTDQLSNLFKHGFERPRPCREEHLQEIIRYIAPRCGRYGYFSAHAASSMALAVFLGLLLRNTQRYLAPLLLVWSSMVGFSRIYVGVHYPLDVLTGMVIGALVGWLIYKLAHRLELTATPRTFARPYRPSNGHGSLPKPARRRT